MCLVEKVCLLRQQRSALEEYSSAWVSRTPETALYEPLLQVESVSAQTLQDGRTLYSKQSYVLFVFRL